MIALPTVTWPSAPMTVWPLCVRPMTVVECTCSGIIPCLWLNFPAQARNGYSHRFAVLGNRPPGDVHTLRVQMFRDLIIAQWTLGPLRVDHIADNLFHFL